MIRKAALSVRPAIAGDVPALIRLAEELASHHRTIAPGEVPEVFARDLAAETFRAAIAGDDNGLCTALFGDQVAGFALWAILDIPHTVLSRPVRCLYVLQIAVGAEFRRKRVGAAIMGHLAASAEAIGADSMGLDVLVENRAAFQFFSRCGFAPSSLVMKTPVTARRAV